MQNERRLVTRRADHDVDAARRARLDTREDCVRNNVAVDHRTEWADQEGIAAPHGRADVFDAERRRGADHPVHRHRRESVGRCIDVQQLREVCGVARRRLDLLGSHRRSADRDCSAKQSRSGRHGEQMLHGDAARRLPEDRHVVGVATERRNVVAYPAQRRHLILKTEVAGHAVDEHEAVDVHAVVDRHVDDAVAHERGSVVRGNASRADGESAAVNPDHDRQPRPAGIGRPHVEVEAVLADNGRVVPAVQLFVRVELRLRHAFAEHQRVAYAVPLRDRLGRQEAVRSERRRRERHTAKDDATVNAFAAEHASRGRDVHVVRSRRVRLRRCRASRCCTGTPRGRALPAPVPARSLRWVRARGSRARG